MGAFDRTAKTGKRRAGSWTARRFWSALACVLCLVSTLTVPARAVQPDEVLPDAQLEQRARGLSQQLRCMVCQNQSIDDSDAPLAKDLRLLVRERLKAGDSDGQVVDYMVARYGEFVLLKPRWSVRTMLLWVTPALVLLAGAVALLIALRKRRTLAVDAVAAPLTPAEQQRLADLVGPEKN